MTPSTIHPHHSTPAPAMSAGWLARIENAFVRWQAARLQEIPAAKLWAKALQDTRSLAEARRAAR